MGNRSRYVVVGSAAAGVVGVRAVLRARRRARLGRAAEGFADDIMPSLADEVPSTAPAPHADEAHAPGHRHLPIGGEVLEGPAPATAREQPFVENRHGLRPGR